MGENRDIGPHQITIASVFEGNIIESSDVLVQQKRLRKVNYLLPESANLCLFPMLISQDFGWPFCRVGLGDLKAKGALKW